MKFIHGMLSFSEADTGRFHRKKGKLFSLKPPVYQDLQGFPLIHTLYEDDYEIKYIFIWASQVPSSERSYSHEDHMQ